MSLSEKRLNITQSWDPRVDLTEEDLSYNVLKGGTEVNPRFYTTTDYSSSQVRFSVIAPSTSHVLDPAIMVSYPITALFTGTGSGNLLNIGVMDALRAAPINNKLTNNMQVGINDAAIQINSGDINTALYRYMNPVESRTSWGSTTPNMPDFSQEYSDLTLGNRNPLGSYADGQVEDPRGGFPMVVNYNNNTGASVTFMVTERLNIPPFVYGDDRYAKGFTFIQNLDITLNISSLNNLWSHANGGNTITSINSTFSGNPQLHLVWITRNPLVEFPKEIFYNTVDIQRFSSPTITLASGASAIVTSNSVQLSGTPLRLLVFARSQNSDLLNNPTMTDTFMNISNIQFLYGNRNALLGSASEQELYQMSVKNGLIDSWTQWNQYVGSVLSISPAYDLGLGVKEVQGLGETVQMQCTVTLNNKGSLSKNVVLYVVPIYEGVMTMLYDNSTRLNLNIVRQDDISASYSGAAVNFADVQNLMVGGSFWSSLKSIVAPIGRFLKKTKLISRVASFIPHPVAKGVGAVANALGYGVRKVRRRKRARRGGAFVDLDEYEEVWVDDAGNDVDPEDVEEETPVKEKKVVSKTGATGGLARKLGK